MTPIAAVLFVLSALLIVGAVFLAWHFSSRRKSLPCPVWLGWMVEMDNPFTRVNRAAEIIRHLAVEPGMHVADIGCGPGRLTIPLAGVVGDSGRVLAVDVQEGMLERVREKARARNLRQVAFLQAAVGSGRLPVAAFDRAALVTVLGEIPDREAALNEIRESLKPDGILSITEVIFDPHFQTRKTLRRLAAQSGLQETAFHGNRIAYTMHFRKAPVKSSQLSG